KGVELATISGSGPDGRITRKDIEARIAEQPLVGPVRVLAAPAVRKLARDHNVDLSTVPGTGQEGRRTRADVEAFLNTRRVSIDPKLRQSSSQPSTPSATAV